VGEQLGVSQVPQAGAVVSHDVGWARDVVMQGQVPVVSLVECSQAEEVCGRPCGSGGALAVPVQRGCVVSKVVDGALSNVSSLGQDVELGNGAC